MLVGRCGKNTANLYVLPPEATGCLNSVEYRLLVKGFAVRQTPFYERQREMRLVSISPVLLEAYSQDREVMHKAGRPYVLVIRLKYKERSLDFAVPIRSNIPAAAPKDQYFALPPRPSTKPKNRHGLHYIKMFPVAKRYLLRYRTEGNLFAELIQTIIEKNKKEIICACQRYLDDYAAGVRPPYATDLDLLVEKLDEMK